MKRSPEAKLAADIVGLWTVLPPVIVKAAANTSVVAYDRSLVGRCKKIIIQNPTGSNAFYAFNQDASDTCFHGLIKTDDYLELDKDQVTAIDKISIFSKTPVNAVVTIYKGT